MALVICILWFQKIRIIIVFIDDILLTVTRFFVWQALPGMEIPGGWGSKAKSTSALHGGWIFSGTTHTVLFCNLACMPCHPLFPLPHDIKGICNKGNETSACRLFLKNSFHLLKQVITKDDKFLITSDRDEKIRVSCYPNSYNIHSFCLGSLE